MKNNRPGEEPSKKKHVKQSSLDKKKNVMVNSDDDEFQPVRQSKRTTPQSVKRKRIAFSNEELNVTTHSGESQKQRKARKPKDRNVVSRTDFPALISRTTFWCLVDSFEKFNDKQKAAVVDLGFGNLTHMNVKELPTKIAYWAVKSFNPYSCELSLQNDRRLHVEEEDVYRVFGFPKGTEIMKRKGKGKSFKLLVQWHEFFKDKGSILHEELASVMLQQVDGGVWFKRHFLALVTSSLIENRRSGYINPHILQYFDDVDGVSKLNWGEYTLRSLIDNRIAWDGVATKSFCGPSLFITAFYVDRVVMRGRVVERSFPTCRNLTYTTLKERQDEEMKAGGFGCGFPCGPVILHKADTSVNNPNTPLCNESGNGNLSKQDVQLYAAELIKNMRDLADRFVKLMGMIEKAPQDIIGDAQFNKTIENTHKLFGYSMKETVNVGNKEPSRNMDSQLQDDFWDREDVIHAVDELEKAIIKRTEYMRKLDDTPTFSLGLTQIFKDIEDNVIQEENPLTDDVDVEHDVGLGAYTTPVNGNKDIEKESFGLHPNENPVMDDVDVEHDVGLGAYTSPVIGNKDIEKESFGLHPNENPLMDDVDVEHDVGLGAYTSPVIGNKDIEKAPAPKDQQHKMCRRNMDDVRKTDNLSSPYITRAVNATEKMTKTEKELAFFTMHNPEANLENILFKCDDVELRRRELMTMRQGSFISIAIIDVWSIILNKNERLRSPESPARFFATTDTCLQSVVSPPNDWTEERRMNNFHEKLEIEISNLRSSEQRNIDMFFFPIYRSTHFFIFCIDVKKETIYVIDNMNDGPEKGKFENYENDALNLRKYFCYFLSKGRQIAKSKRLANASFSIINMLWVDSNNNIDCGIYTMRHMETFMGEPNKSWQTSLSKKSKMQMKTLRVKYCAYIVAADCNEMKDKNVKEANLFYRLSCEDGPLKLDGILLG
ncbi:hypothetical protein OROMI_016112 [Orobanche minor]